MGDKIFQTSMVKCILEPVYEHEFCGFSYGFRLGRSAHNALDALVYVIERRKVGYVVHAEGVIGALRSHIARRVSDILARIRSVARFSIP